MAKKTSSENDTASAKSSCMVRDRWFDAVATDETMLSLPADGSDCNTYDVARQLEASSPSEERKKVTNVKRLAA
ncbi:MAG: hypothetical protein AAGJ38_03940 [Planctomycetota bacterium]